MTLDVSLETASCRKGLSSRFGPVLAFVMWAVTLPVQAQERPYFITYNQEMEEPGNFEVALNPVYGTQRDAPSFLAGSTEFEYGVRAWWTTGLYLAGQTTRHDSTLFTGYRF